MLARSRSASSSRSCAGSRRWNGDQGVFLSIAARLLDGDRLYAEVIDNKDPLFFYAHAGAFWVGGWRGPPALDALWLGVAALSFALLAPRAGGAATRGVGGSSSTRSR